MSLPLKWEFPGGKIEPENTPEECLKSGADGGNGNTGRVKAGQALLLHTHSYPAFTVTLYPFVCSVESGNIVLHEHAAITWLAPGDLHGLDWAEADLPVIAAYLSARDGVGVVVG